MRKKRKTERFGSEDGKGNIVLVYFPFFFFCKKSMFDISSYELALFVLPELPSTKILYGKVITFFDSVFKLL